MGRVLRRSAPAERRSVKVLRTAVADHLLEAGVAPERVEEVRLAVSEAVTNAVLHAYPNGNGEVHVEARLDRRDVLVVVRDDGHGMAPRADSPGAGLGLPIIASLATRLEVGYADGPGSGTAVRMTFPAA